MAVVVVVCVEQRVSLLTTTLFSASFFLPPPSKMPLSKAARLQMGISAYNKGHFKSKLKAARVFAVPETTLRARLDGRKSRTETRPSGHKLKAIEEKTLIKKLLEADRRGFPIRPKFLRGMTQLLLCEYNPTAKRGIKWAYSFVKRHLALRTRYNRRITYQHAKQDDPSVIISWFEAVHAAIQELAIHDVNI
jgi:hypothetical protein